MFSCPFIAKTRILLVLLSALVVNGCGQKGDLFLPDDEAAEATTQYLHGKLFL